MVKRGKTVPVNERQFHGPKDYLDLARSPEATPDDLRFLAMSPYSFVVEAVAAHPATPVDVLDEIILRSVSTWSDQEIVLALAKNPHSTGAAFAAIASFVPTCLHIRDAHQVFHAGIVLFERDDVPDRVLFAMLDSDEVTTEFRKVAARQTTHPAVVERLLKDRSERVRRAAERRTQ